VAAVGATVKKRRSSGAGRVRRSPRHRVGVWDASLWLVGVLWASP